MQQVISISFIGRILSVSEFFFIVCNAALAFDIVTEAEFAKLSDPKGSAYKVDPTVPKGIEHGKREDGKEDAHQPPYMFGTTQVEVLLKTGNIYDP